MRRQLIVLELPADEFEQLPLPKAIKRQLKKIGKMWLIFLPPMSSAGFDTCVYFILFTLMKKPSLAPLIAAAQVISVASALAPAYAMQDVIVNLGPEEKQIVWTTSLAFSSVLSALALSMLPISLGFMHATDVPNDLINAIKEYIKAYIPGAVFVMFTATGQQFLYRTYKGRIAEMGLNFLTNVGAIGLGYLLIHPSDSAEKTARNIGLIFSARNILSALLMHGAHLRMSGFSFPNSFQKLSLLLKLLKKLLKNIPLILGQFGPFFQTSIITWAIVTRRLGEEAASAFGPHKQVSYFQHTAATISMVTAIQYLKETLKKIQIDTNGNRGSLRPYHMRYFQRALVSSGIFSISVAAVGLFALFPQIPQNLLGLFFHGNDTFTNHSNFYNHTIDIDPGLQMAVDLFPLSMVNGILELGILGFIQAMCVLLGWPTHFSIAFMLILWGLEIPLVFFSPLGDTLEGVLYASLITRGVGVLLGAIPALKLWHNAQTIIENDMSRTEEARARVEDTETAHMIEPEEGPDGAASPPTIMMPMRHLSQPTPPPRAPTIHESHLNEIIAARNLLKTPFTNETSTTHTDDDIPVRNWRPIPPPQKSTMSRIANVLPFFHKKTSAPPLPPKESIPPSKSTMSRIVSAVSFFQKEAAPSQPKTTLQGTSTHQKGQVFSI